MAINEATHTVSSLWKQFSSVSAMVKGNYVKRYIANGSLQKSPSASDFLRVHENSETTSFPDK